MNVPIGHGCKLQGTWASVSSPKQGFPPLASGGSEQVLFLVLNPPKHVLLQSVYTLHAAQFPSETFLKFCKNLPYFYCYVKGHYTLLFMYK